MNFIDRALAQGPLLSDDGFLQAMADIYKEPQVWQVLDRYPQYIQDVIYIIDYDTEVQMEGLDACAASLTDSGLDYEDEAVDAEMETLYRQISLNQNYEGFWALVRGYIKRSNV